MNTVADINKNIKDRLEALALTDADYWSFRKKAVREHAHAYFQYPAMMVPKLQGELIKTFCEADSKIQNIYDPFVGSGTVLTESMTQGLSFTGQDINPLAILICKAKKGPFLKRELEIKVERLFSKLDIDQNKQVDINFPGLNKWFRKDVQVELARIRRNVKSEESSWVRRFFWVALAETVRLSSNSRTSTFKLHIRPQSEINRKISPINSFKQILTRNFKRFEKIESILSKKNLLTQGQYTAKVDIQLSDVRKHNASRKHDLLVTSPPYGDNHTTVPYGQHSYLPLQWIELSDIDSASTDEYIRTTHSIDSKSLGGSKKNALIESRDLRDISPTFNNILLDLENEPKDRKNRVAAFCRDLNNSLDPILSKLRRDAFMIWTVGNRRVANRLIAIDKILEELLSDRGAKTITKLKRRIPSKRMAIKNNFSSTMGAETILIMRVNS